MIKLQRLIQLVQNYQGYQVLHNEWKQSKSSVLAISKDLRAPANLVKSMDEGTFEKSERNCGRCLKTYGVDEAGM